MTLTKRFILCLILKQRRQKMASAQLTGTVFDCRKKLREVGRLRGYPIPVKAAVSAMGYGAEVLRMPLTPMEEPFRSVMFEEMRKLGIEV